MTDDGVQERADTERSAIYEVAMRVRGGAGPNAVGSECLDYALGLAQALHDEGRSADVVGGAFRCDVAVPDWDVGRSTDDNPPLPWPYAVFPHVIEAAWAVADDVNRVHFWVETGPWLVDISSDQFYEWMDVAPEPVVVVMVAESDRHTAAGRWTFSPADLSGYTPTRSPDSCH